MYSELVKNPDSRKSKFLNGFLIEDGLIMLVTWFSSVIFDSNMDNVEVYNH